MNENQCPPDALGVTAGIGNGARNPKCVAQRRGLIISNGWIQAALLVFIIGFTILLYLAYRTYDDAPPIPDQVVGPAGQVIFTGRDILDGQEIFLLNGLMEYGSVFGHGAYLGPDYTADYLRRAALSVRDQLGGAGSDQARACLGS